MNTINFTFNLYLDQCSFFKESEFNRTITHLTFAVYIHFFHHELKFTIKMIKQLKLYFFDFMYILITEQKTMISL